VLAVHSIAHFSIYFVVGPGWRLIKIGIEELKDPITILTKIIISIAVRIYILILLYCDNNIYDIFEDTKRHVYARI